jgi:hypothetical protein
MMIWATDRRVMVAPIQDQIPFLSSLSYKRRTRNGWRIGWPSSFSLQSWASPPNGSTFCWVETDTALPLERRSHSRQFHYFLFRVSLSISRRAFPWGLRYWQRKAQWGWIQSKDWWGCRAIVDRTSNSGKMPPSDYNLITFLKRKNVSYSEPLTGLDPLKTIAM